MHGLVWFQMIILHDISKIISTHFWCSETFMYALQVCILLSKRAI